MGLGFGWLVVGFSWLWVGGLGEGVGPDLDLTEPHLDLDLAKPAINYCCIKKGFLKFCFQFQNKAIF